MRLVRVKHVLITVAAMLSLAVSAVSACACSHHEPEKKVFESSCHGPSHEAPIDDQPSLLGTHFESDCDCFVRTPAPGIAAVKKDDKRTGVETPSSNTANLSASVAIDLDLSYTTRSAFQRGLSNYQQALLASLPSRAPPRS